MILIQELIKHFVLGTVTMAEYGKNKKRGNKVQIVLIQNTHGRFITAKKAKQRKDTQSINFKFWVSFFLVV